ncbi:MAG: hypothetical protein RSB77_02740 [Bacilli bacterium]
MKKNLKSFYKNSNFIILIMLGITILSFTLSSKYSNNENTLSLIFLNAGYLFSLIVLIIIGMKISSLIKKNKKITLTNTLGTSALTMFVSFLLYFMSYNINTTLMQSLAIVFYVSLYISLVCLINIIIDMLNKNNNKGLFYIFIINLLVFLSSLLLIYFQNIKFINSYFLGEIVTVIYLLSTFVFITYCIVIALYKSFK